MVDPTIAAIHVGGRGAMGPIECLFQLRESLSLSVFEANIEDENGSWAEYERLTGEYAARYGITLSVKSRCLSDAVGRREFHINVMPDCSSLLRMSPDAKNYQRDNLGKCRLVWGQICQPRRSVELDVTTLDALCADNVVQTPHFISLDVQGAEYGVLEGASMALRGDLLGVVSEVEFRELYDRQKLFTDQHALLRQHEFRLFDLYNTEYWYSGPIVGKGALTVAEALFLRDFRYFVGRDLGVPAMLSNLSKLATVACCFERQSYALEIMDYILGNWRHEWDAFVQETNAKYLHDLVRCYSDLKSSPSEMEKLPTYLEYCENPERFEREEARGSPPPQSIRQLVTKAVPWPLRRAIRALLTRLGG